MNINNKTKPSFVPWTDIDTSLGPGSKFSSFITDAVAAHKEMCLFWNTRHRRQGRGWAGGKTPFLKPSFLRQIIQRETLSSSLPAWCHPSSKGNSIALGSWWFMEPVSAGRLLFVLQLVFINDQQPADWGQKQQALCLICSPRLCQLQASRGPLATG